MRGYRWLTIAWTIVLTGTISLGAGGAARAEVQPGDTITKDNIDKAGDLLIPTVKWLVAQGMPIKVIPYRKIELPQLYKEATEKYSGQVKISADGHDIYNYVAGLPFPTIDPNDPLAGAKIMWNHEQKPTYIDNVGTEWITELVNSKGELERTYGSEYGRRMMWTGRLYADPKPVIPHSPAIRYTEQFGPLFIPNDLKGASALTFRYLAPDMPDDSYMYLPELRRVRRISVANRSDAFWGSDIDLDSVWGFASKVSYWTFRLLAEKEILAPVHSGKYGDRSAWCAEPDGKSGVSAFLPCNINWEKRKVYVVEGIPTAYSQYAYSKRIMYPDKEFWNMNYDEMSDSGGELWKCWFNIFNFTTKPYEEYPTKPLKGGKYNYTDEWPFTPNGMMVDVQTAHATKWDAPSGHVKPSEWLTEWYFNEAVQINTVQAYSVNFLVQSAR
jgi:hypothetical protein